MDAGSRSVPSEPLLVGCSVSIGVYRSFWRAFGPQDMAVSLERLDAFPVHLSLFRLEWLHSSGVGSSLTLGSLLRPFPGFTVHPGADGGVHSYVTGACLRVFLDDGWF